jgi:hypothetical protein
VVAHEAVLVLEWVVVSCKEQWRGELWYLCWSIVLVVPQRGIAVLHVQGGIEVVLSRGNVRIEGMRYQTALRDTLLRSNPL